ncbi:hypothetical protein [Bacillus cereus]|nr:hypothetical protein [Bacillus cereus]
MIDKHYALTENVLLFKGRFLAKKIKKIYEVNGIVVVSIIDLEDRDYE